MTNIIHVDFKLARKFRTALSDAHTLKAENVSFDAIRVYEEIYAKIKESGMPLQSFSFERVLGDLPDNPQVIEADFTPPTPPSEVMDRYKQEVYALNQLELSPDDLEIRLLDLMTRAKKDGVDLHKLCR